MITYCVGTPLSRLILAINHYISTGDLIGMGTAMEEGRDRTRPLILVNRNLAEDRANFACFRSRFDELAVGFGTELVSVGGRGPFDAWTFSIRNRDLDVFARELQKQPGPLGWGTTKRQIDRLAGQG